MSTKFIFITGGVISSLGKGIAAASIGGLLAARDIRLSMIKMDPYINVDPGTMNPYQHGEVFVTDDGGETDLDLGHYERYTGITTTRRSNCTSGRIYQRVIEKERAGQFLGKTVQVIPHITNEIKDSIHRAAEGSDVCIVEIGGTVGDIESLPFLEAIRQMKHDLGERRSVFVHLTLVPWINSAQEMKTKPTQHSVMKMREIGIQPHILICRCEQELPDELKEKISLFTDVPKNAVITARDVDCVYEIPLLFHRDGLDAALVERLDLGDEENIDLSYWETILIQHQNRTETIRLAMVGKYTAYLDSYKSVVEALEHSALANGVKIEIEAVNSEKLTADNVQQHLRPFDGVLIPGGFGERGTQGKIEAVRYARQNGVPFLGICLGFQMALIEFARNVLGIPEANTTEIDPHTAEPIVDLMEEQKKVHDMGATMRLGGFSADLAAGSRACSIYGQTHISERHRHRYELNNAYLERLEGAGMRISGKNTDLDLAEVLEIAEHPWFVAVQYHPEFLSRPGAPHPLFQDLTKHMHLLQKGKERE